MPSLVPQFMFRLAVTALALVALALPGAAASAQDRPGWVQWRPLEGPCDGDCSASVFGGWYVDNSLGQVLVTSPETPFTWDYKGDYIVGAAVSRRIATLWNHVDIEPEFGVGQRFGQQHETEIWGAFFFRYRGFPWDRYVVNTIAVSTGLNYATDISNEEQERARDDKGSRWMHYFAPEITFASPRAPQYELLFRMHHRSGVFGLISDAWGGAQYGTVGLRVRF